LAGDAGQCFSNIGCRLAAFRVHILQELRDVLRVFRASSGIVSLIRSAIIVGDGCDVDPRFAATAAGAVKFVGADVDECGGVAVVGVFEDDDVFAAGVRTGEAQRKFVGFAAGIDEVANAQAFGQKTRQALSIAVHVVVEIAGVGVEKGDLILDGADDARMTVPDERHVVVSVEIGAACIVVEELLPTADDFERMLIRDA